MSASVVVTGVPEVDRAMAQFEAKVQKKYARTALNNAIKFVETKYKELVPVETGAMRDATKRRTPKAKRRGDIGRSLIIDRDRLFKLRTARSGRPPGSRQGEDGPFFYPAVIELGDKDTPAQRPLRAALYGNEQQIKQEFVNQLRAAIATAGK